MVSTSSKSDYELLREQYAEFFVHGNTSVAKHLMEHLITMHDNNIRKAQESSDPMEAYGYLKAAFGIMEVRKHINSMSSKDVTPKK